MGVGEPLWLWQVLGTLKALADMACWREGLVGRSGSSSVCGAQH